MTDTFYGIDVPGSQGNPDNVTKAASTNGTTVELRVTDGTTGMNKVEIQKALTAIGHFIVQDDAPA